MSEKKYYVKLIQTGLVYKEERYQLYLWKYDGKYSYSPKDYTEEHYPDKLHRYQYTKKELTEVMNGAILKRISGGTNLDDLGKDKSCYVWIEDCNYWKNPLIELVPVGVKK
ncbi:hypothetical protein [Lactococcus lactis]|uniref:hypothetical protein n=1 Tax=Lactococcus lactis TaxID=1358 RepID=UPI00288EC030|nr:hypothetical protein [Lactococcus lactis]MDT2909317.1 hypothetical protein [Lactococcus lactis]MDT2925153.1 hypothetical protein [Lactococcus lactis]MDT2952012.1 hypothetical protein [Lactococcus lactis]